MFPFTRYGLLGGRVIAIEPGSFAVDGRDATLLPGMSIKAEILTGKRCIIDFLLAPLREHDAMRER